MPVWTKHDRMGTAAAGIVKENSNAPDVGGTVKNGYSADL